MNKAFEEIMERLDNVKTLMIDGAEKYDYNKGSVEAYENAKKIVQSIAKEYKNKDYSQIIRKLLFGEWVDSDKVQKALGMSFNECFSLFDFSRTAEWWSIVGKTEEERAREGQKVVVKFRLKSIPEHTYENCHNVTCRRKCERDGYNKAIDEFAKALKKHINNIHEPLDGYDVDEVVEELKKENN